MPSYFLGKTHFFRWSSKDLSRLVPPAFPWLPGCADEVTLALCLCDKKHQKCANEFLGMENDKYSEKT